MNKARINKAFRVRLSLLTIRGDGELACVDLKKLGVVIKRCYFSGNQWFLGSINQNDSYPPILLDMSEIYKVHLLKGILFEVASPMVDVMGAKI